MFGFDIEGIQMSEEQTTGRDLEARLKEGETREASSTPEIVINAADLPLPEPEITFDEEGNVKSEKVVVYRFDITRLGEVMDRLIYHADKITGALDYGNWRLDKEKIKPDSSGWVEISVVRNSAPQENPELSKSVDDLRRYFANWMTTN